MELWHDYTFICSFFLAARGTNQEAPPQLSEACLYSNPPLLLSLRVFLTPPSFGHLPYILRCKTQRRRVIVILRSLRCNTPHTGHGRGGVKYLSSSLFYCCFNPSVTSCHLPYILRYKTQGRRVIPASEMKSGIGLFSLLFCSTP